MAATGGRSSKAKGANYERELALYLTGSLFNGDPERAVRRALLSGGGRSDGGADLDNLPRVWAEAKRLERLNIRDALRQAEEGVARTKDGRMPVVMTRRNREKTEDSIVALRLKDFTKLLTAYYAQEKVA